MGFRQATGTNSWKACVAIYHLRAKVIQRAKGQSAIKSASYRHGERLYDERLGRAFSYRKPDVVHSEIIAPAGAPDWVFSRYELWNRAEAAETRCNAQVAREIELSLPKELSPQERVQLVREFFTTQFVERGMIADIAIHVPMDSNGEPQPHAHVMLTMRRLDSATPTGFARLKARDWNEDPAIEDALRKAKDEFRKSETPELAGRIAELDSQRNINVWRAAWAKAANAALETAGAFARIDHRTLEEQGILREAQPHLGLARHIEKAYGHLKERVATWVAVLKRNELYRAFAPYLTRDPAKFGDQVAAITSFTDSVMDHWRKRPRPPQGPIQEVEL
jgi:ATP-dependent exoDNAse (exonuclease V) alpha subunit